MPCKCFGVIPTVLFRAGGCQVVIRKGGRYDDSKEWGLDIYKSGNAGRFIEFNYCPLCGSKMSTIDEGESMSPDDRRAAFRTYFAATWRKENDVEICAHDARLMVQVEEQLIKEGKL